MGFFEKFRREKPSPQTPGSSLQPVGAPEPNTGVIVLFDRQNIDVKELETAISERFGAESVLQIDSSSPSVTHLMLRIDGIDAVCSYMPFPLPGEEGDIPALLRVNRYITQEEQAALLAQKSFCLIAELGGGKTLQGKRTVCLALTRLCGGLLAVDGAAGVYYGASNLLLGKKMYVNYAAIAQREAGNPDYFPAMLWVLVYQTHTGDGAPTVETCGLAQFGFLELVFYKPAEEWAQSFEKLYIMSTLEITEKEVYKNMDTISFTAGQFSIFKQDGKKLAVIGGI